MKMKRGAIHPGSHHVCEGHDAGMRGKVMIWVARVETDVGMKLERYERLTGKEMGQVMLQPAF